jgi:hypothetical protein
MGEFRPHVDLMTKQSKPIADSRTNAAVVAEELRAQAALLPSGLERDVLLRRARQAETAAKAEAWAASPGLQPPK